MVLQCGITLFNVVFYLIDRVKYSRVILVNFFANIGCAEVGKFSDQIDSHLTRFRGNFVFQSAAQNGLIDGVELADLGDD